MAALTWRCEVCGTDGQPLSGREATPFDTVAGSETFRHPAYRVGRCAGCAVYQKSRRLPDEALGRYYARLEHESFESASLMPPDRAIVAAAKRLPPGSRILDYGCGIGRSLSASVGPHACFGVEPNERAAALARARGITLVDDAAMQSQLAASIDLVVLADVYEHLLDPLGTLRRLAACLKPGGALLLFTGLADAVHPAELLPESWYFRIAGHLRMASMDHLEWLAGRTGLALEDRRALCHYDPAPLRDLAQRFRLWAYAATHLRPANAAARIVARLPLVGRAARWTNAPMLSCGRDHVLATFRKPGEAV